MVRKSTGEKQGYRLQVWQEREGYLLRDWQPGGSQQRGREGSLLVVGEELDGTKEPYIMSAVVRRVNKGI